jgi:hypothetical protein
MSIRSWGAFVALSVIWGVPYLFIKLAVPSRIRPRDVAYTQDRVVPALYGRKDR